MQAFTPVGNTMGSFAPSGNAVGGIQSSFSYTPPTPISKPAAPVAHSQTSSTIKSNPKDAQYNLDEQGIVGSAGRTAMEYGASAPTYNADTGTLSGMQVDWSNPGGVAKLNPFGRAALLIKSYQQGVQGTSNSYAARGQHNSGAYQRAQNENLFGFEQGKAGINTALMNFITGANQGISQALLNAIARQEATPVPIAYDTSNPATGAVPISAVGEQTIGSDAAGQATLNEWSTSRGGHSGSIKLANGWSIKYVNGKPQFIPPGGK